MPQALWPLLTRLGEAQILLPTAALLALWFARRGRSLRLVAMWLLGLAGAIGLTTLSKIAFMGYGWGFAPLDYTGISGHSMFAASVYPLAGVAVLHAVAGPRALAWHAAGLAPGAALALLVGASRVVVGAHSVFEVLTGLGLGALVSLAALSAARLPAVRPALWLPFVLAAWLIVTPAHAPPSTTHGLVTQLALQVSGRSTPYSRADLHRDWLQRHARR
jgi:membrane-associated phospholipid phosphatase